jgi:hypothetical protein
MASFFWHRRPRGGLGGAAGVGVTTVIPFIGATTIDTLLCLDSKTGGIVFLPALTVAILCVKNMHYEDFLDHGDAA